MSSVPDWTRMREYIGNYNCTSNQYYDDYLKTCSPCKDVCPILPCKICPEFVMTTEPVFKTETAMDASMTAFWVVLCMIIITLIVLVVVFVLHKRYQLIKMCKKKAWSQEVTVSAVEETEQAQMLQTLKEPRYEQANPC